MTDRITAVGSAGAARARRAPRAGREAPTDVVFVGRVCERLTAELFGASRQDHERGRSIHAQLCALDAQCEPAHGEFEALSPSPALDRCLGRLVEIVRGQFDPDLAERTCAAVALNLARLIAADPALLRKAHDIRRIAGCAEAEMEHRVCAALLETLALRSSSRAGDSEREGSRNLAQALREVFSGFRYFDSYARLIRAEIALLLRPIVPLFARADSALDLAPAAGHLLAELQGRCAEALGPDARALPPSGLDGKTIAVCGCGPLPLSGLLLQIATGAHVVLIDRDPRALGQAAKLVSELQRVGVLAPDGLSLVLADAGELDYGPDAAGSVVPHVTCDVVLIASLVPHAVKQRIAARVREAKSRAPLALILRSAAGLCAELAYEPVCTEQISGLGLVYCGQSSPRARLWNDERLPGTAGSVAMAAQRELRVVADPSVLNTSELYVRTSFQLSHDPLGGAPWPWSPERIEHGIRLLCA